MRKALHRSQASIHTCTCSHMHTPTQTHTTNTQSFSWVCTCGIIRVMCSNYPDWLFPTPQSQNRSLFDYDPSMHVGINCPKTYRSNSSATLPIWLHRLATHRSLTGFASWTNITKFQPVIWDRVLRNTVRAKPLLDTRKSSFWLKLCCSNIQVPTGLHTQSPMCGCGKTARQV